MGLINDFNEIDMFQTDVYIKISCATYINLLVTTHRWKEDKCIKAISKTIAPISTKALKQVYKQKGPAEGTMEHKTIKMKAGFSYLTLLGEMNMLRLRADLTLGTQLLFYLNLDDHAPQSITILDLRMSHNI